MSHRQANICGSKGRIFGDGLLEEWDPRRWVARRPFSETTKEEVVSFCAGFVTPAALAQLEAQTIDYTARNLVLDRENIRKLSVIAARPDGKIVAGANQVYINPQLLPRPQHRTFHEVVRLQLFSRVTCFLWLAFESKGGGLRANRQAVNDRQVAYELAGQAVSEVLISGVLVQVEQR